MPPWAGCHSRTLPNGTPCGWPAYKTIQKFWLHSEFFGGSTVLVELRLVSQITDTFRVNFPW